MELKDYLNHHPDFIVKTKGNDRDNTDSELKLKLGKLWVAKAGRDSAT
jgi:type III restriction enzyme